MSFCSHLLIRNFPFIFIVGDEAKFKWQKLKGKFKTLLRKSFEDSKITGSVSATPKWKFYHSMLFLKDSIQSGATKSTTPMAANNNTIKTINSEQSEENDDDFEEFNFDFIVPRTSNTEANDRKPKPGPRSSKRKITNNGEVDDKTQEPDDKNFMIPPTLVHQDERKGNDDHHFLWSLMPYIQALDSVEKLELRSQIQNLVTTSFKKHEANKRPRMYH